MRNSFIKKKLRSGLNECLITENKGKLWYHGTPDVRELEKVGGFTQKYMDIQYINNLEGYYNLMGMVKDAREDNNEDEYFKLLNMVPKFKSYFKLRKPIFLTNDISVAKTYADSKRAVDYQNSIEKVVKLHVAEGNGVKIIATGDRFRFIDVNKVKSGFINAGVKKDKLNKVIEQFTFYQQQPITGIKTDVIAVIGEWFKFDYIDVVGVLDSYNGGTIQSTVRMVFDPSIITLL